MGMTVVLTGAAGFIGSHAAIELGQRGHRVVGIDNFNDYYAPERKRSNVREVQAAVGNAFELVECDIRDRARIDAIFERFRPGAVLHLAAMAGVRASVEDPWLYYDVNLTGTLNLLEASKSFGKPNFVFAGTSSAYGRTQQIPFVEDNACDRPLAPYPASKRAAELLGFSYHHLHGLDFCALRFFTVYGPRGRPDMMAYKVLSSMFSEVAVPLYNGGQMHRDWTYVSDVVAGLAQAAERRLGYELINIGRGEPVLLRDFVRKIEALVGRKAKLREEPMPAADIAYTYADIAKAKRLLDYNPGISVDVGVERFWDWYRAAVLSDASWQSVSG